jgi:penicillin V acylase-like amidase (Ntn superfamily)
MKCPDCHFTVTTVNEAVSFVQHHPFQLLPVIADTSGEVSNVHLMIEDILGDVAVFEYTDETKDIS